MKDFHLYVYCQPGAAELYPTHAFLNPSSDGSAGVDLRAYQSKVIQPNCTEFVGTGLHIAPDVPFGKTLQLFAMIVPRSGLGSKGIILANSVGIIDQDYRGEILLAIRNEGKEEFQVNRGDRIAQMLFLKFSRAKVRQVLNLDDLSTTTRGSGGFGSTGHG